MTQRKTLLAICSDSRLVTRDQQLCNSVRKNEGDFPYRLVKPGGCLHYQTDQALEESILPLLYADINHLHLEDHMGANPQISGCKAYWLENRNKFGDQRYPWQVEKNDHVNKLREIGWQILEFSKRHGTELTITAGLYLHDDRGRGTLQLVPIEEPSRYETAFR